jgi:hypothetical protein
MGKPKRRKTLKRQNSQDSSHGDLEASSESTTYVLHFRVCLALLTWKMEKLTNFENEQFVDCGGRKIGYRVPS